MDEGVKKAPIQEENFNMIRHFILTLSAFIILGCASGGGGGLSDDEGRFDFKRVTKFDGRVLDVEVTRENGRTIRLNTARDSAYSIPSPPLMPNHSGRSWTLLNAASDGATIVYALVNWDNDRQTDYLAAGWWLHFQGRLRFPRIPIFDAENGIFIDGPELDTSNPPGMPVTGEATYVGASGCLYAYRYGSGSGNLEGTETFQEVQGIITLRADFSGNTIQGCIGCVGDIVIGRSHLHAALGWRPGDPPEAMPTDYEVHLGPTPFNRNGAFQNADVRVTHPGRSVTESGGQWSGRFSNRPDGDGNPRLVTGFTQSWFQEDDGGRGLFLGLFNALSETYRASGRNQGP